MDRKSEDEGLEISRLPVFTEEEKTRIIGTYMIKMYLIKCIYVKAFPHYLPFVKRMHKSQHNVFISKRWQEYKHSMSVM